MAYFTTSSRPVENSEFTIKLGPGVGQLVMAVNDVVGRLAWAEVAYVAHRQTSRRKF